MEYTELLKQDGEVKAKVIMDGNGICLLTMKNGFQWTGQPLTPKLAEVTIKVLQKYLDEQNKLKSVEKVKPYPPKIGNNKFTLRG